MDGRGYRGVPNRLAASGMWAVVIRRGNTFPMLAIRWTEIFPPSIFMYCQISLLAHKSLAVCLCLLKCKIGEI